MNAVSCLSPNLFWFYEAVCRYLSRTFDISIQLKQGRADPLAELRQQPDVAFVCGLPFIQACHASANQFQAIAAPVMQSERYQDRPVYFSDVIVADSSMTRFEQLAGKRFCFNDLGSNSGYNLMRYRLMQGAYSLPFFEQVMQSGSHQQSIQWVAEQKADCAAIDSVVLEQELNRPEYANSQLRVIESLGPNPMPPIVAAQQLGEQFLGSLQAALLQPDAELRSQMQQARIRRFDAVQTRDYEIVHQIYCQTDSSEYAVIR